VSEKVAKDKGRMGLNRQKVYEKPTTGRGDQLRRSKDRKADVGGLSPNHVVGGKRRFESSSETGHPEN